jgi:Ni/Co efflux regulator RcnB
MKSVLAAGLVMLMGMAAATAQTRDGRPDRGADFGAQSSGRGDSQGDKRGDDRGDRGDRMSFERGRGDERRPADRGEWPRDSGGAGRGEPRGRDNAVVAQPFQQTHGFGADRPSSYGRYDRDYGARQGNHGGRRYGTEYRDDDRRQEFYGSSRYDRRHYDHDRYDRQRHDDWRRPDWRRSWSHGWSGSRYRAPARYVYPRGYHSYSWRVGYQIPLAFLIANYYVDYRPYGLSAPPYGCRWVRVDGDLLLVEIRSGEIIDILYEFFY